MKIEFPDVEFTYKKHEVTLRVTTAYCYKNPYISIYIDNKFTKSIHTKNYLFFPEKPEKFMNRCMQEARYIIDGIEIDKSNAFGFFTEITKHLKK